MSGRPTEWLYEDGIGERRAALVEDGEIVEAAIEMDGSGLRVGAVLAARLGAPMPGGALVRIEGGGEALLTIVPPGLSEGGALRVEIVREAISDRGNVKLPQARPAAPDASLSAGPSLRERIEDSGVAVVALSAITEERLEAAGWSDMLEQAAHGRIPFAGGLLRMTLAPAMTLFDVDGTLPATALAVAGAAAAGKAIRQLGIGGSIGIDLPTIAGKPERQAAAAALDAALPPPFERTAVNGFGFLQIVRRRQRQSLPEQLAADPVGAAARALLRRAERGGTGSARLVGAPRVIARLEAEGAWIAALSRSRGGSVTLRADPALSISAGYAEPNSS